MSAPAEKSGLHPRSRHRARYDFAALVAVSPELAPHVRPLPHGPLSIDFADPAAVMALNRALLRHHYGITRWEIPNGYLTPPIPGRADYLHHAADLLASTQSGVIPRGPDTVVLDLGVGANCIYPIIGVCDYQWRFVGTDIDPDALKAARRIVADNPALAGRVELRHQPSPRHLLTGVIREGETFALAVCNPPFHSSPAEALAGTQRKLRNLAGRTLSPAKTILNFGGQARELWCPGGELAFIRRLIAESAQRPQLCAWFTTLVARSAHLPALHAALAAANALEVRTIEMAQGQKRSRILAWRFAPRTPVSTAGR